MTSVQSVLSAYNIPSVFGHQARKAPMTFGHDVFVKNTDANPPISPQMRPFENELTKRIYNSTEKPSGKDVQQWCEEMGTNHLGIPTLDFMNGKPSQKQVDRVFKDMDQLINTIKSHQSKFKKNGLQSQVNGLDVFIEDCVEKQGKYAHVYKLTVNGKSHALKIYDFQETVHGSSEGAANGIFFTHKPVKDLSYMYFSNPKSGYTLYEWLDEKTNIEKRPGRTLWEIGYYNGDDKIYSPKETIRINGVIFDHGGIQKLTPDAIQVRKWHTLPSHPEHRFRLGNLLLLHRKENLSDEWLLGAFKHLLNEVPIEHWNLAALIPYLPNTIREEAFFQCIHAGTRSRQNALEFPARVFPVTTLRKRLKPIFEQYEDTRKKINHILSQAHLSPLEE